MMQFRYIRESEIPSASGRNNDRCEVVKLFLSSGKEALEITFDSVKEARDFARCVQTNKSKVAVKVKAEQRKNIVYLRKNKEVE